MSLACAALALLAGAALALTSGDLRGLIILALGAGGGWAAGRNLTPRPAPVPERARPLAAPEAPAHSREPVLSRAAPPSEPPASTMQAARGGGRSESPPSAHDAEGGTAPANVTGPGVAERVTQTEAELPCAQEPAPALEPCPAAEPVPVAASAVRAPGAASDLATARPRRVDETGSAPADEAPNSGSDASSGPGPAAEPTRADAATDVTTPLPNEERLQDLAARQRSSTADLRRSIRDVIERLEDEEPPARRRGKKPRR